MTEALAEEGVKAKGKQVVVTPRPPKLKALRERMEGFDGSTFARMNEEPDRVYANVYKGDGNQGVAYFEKMGYDVERVVPGGVSYGFDPNQKRKTGDVVETQDHILMSIHVEDKRFIEENGADGQTGSRLVDQLDERMSGGKGRRGKIAYSDMPRMNPNHFALKETDIEPD